MSRGASLYQHMDDCIHAAITGENDRYGDEQIMNRMVHTEMMITMILYLKKSCMGLY